jgi:ABC-type molybdate transport system ATPase subunit
VGEPALSRLLACELTIPLDGRVAASRTLRVSVASDAARVTLTGPSGSGKSTFLRVLAGVAPAVGTIRFAGETWLDGRVAVPPEARQIGWVPQDGALFPHLDVAGNLAFAGATAAAVGEIAARLEILPLLARSVRTLSGGERQRVALGRALLARPRLLLLDEPFAALDDARRDAAAALVAELCLEQAITCVVVSHHAADLDGERWSINENTLSRYVPPK